MTTLAGVIGMAALSWLAVFQLLLAAGAPLGRLAWGGRQRVLAPGFRLASLAVVPFAAFGAIASGQAAGILPDLLPPGLIPWTLWGFFALFGLSLIGNIATDSRPERLHGVPLTVLIAASSLWLALFGM